VEKEIADILSRHEAADALPVLVEFVRKKQVKAWDKGFGKGVKIHHWWETMKGVSNKENRNPYVKRG
jgi:hypothetical protein